MFSRIFKRRPATDKRTSASSQPDPSIQADIPVDETMVALSRELSGLCHMEVGQAAKERGWATLRGELERHPVRRAASAGAKGAGSRRVAGAGAGAHGRTIQSGSRRWILVSTGAIAVVAIAVTAIVYGGGGGQSPVVSNPSSTGTVTSVVSSDTTLPETTVPTDGTTVTSQGPDTTLPETTVPTDGTTVTSQGPDTTSGTTNTTKSPDTTQPQTTTTNEQQMAAAQTEKDAVSAALSLGRMVVDYLEAGGDLPTRLVASGAQADLVQMVYILDHPTEVLKVGTKSLGADTVRVTLQFSDSVSDGQGGSTAVTKRFALDVRVDDSGAKVIAISYAGS